MQGLKTVYYCNHKFANTEFAEKLVMIPLSQIDKDGNLIFFIPKNINPVDITDVCFYKPGAYRDYQPIVPYLDYTFDKLENAIVVSKSRINADFYTEISTQKKLYLDGAFSYFYYHEYEYNANECPRCGGSGWFVDLLNDDDISVKTEDKTKLTQEVIKILFTDDDGNYGAPLKDMLGEAYASLAEFQTRFSEVILLAENRIIDRQSNYVAEGGQLSDSDLLKEINVIEIGSAEGLTAFRIVLQVIAVDDTESEIIVAL